MLTRWLKRMTMRSKVSNRPLLKHNRALARKSRRLGEKALYCFLLKSLRIFSEYSLRAFVFAKASVHKRAMAPLRARDAPALASFELPLFGFAAGALPIFTRRQSKM